MNTRNAKRHGATAKLDFAPPPLHVESLLGPGEEQILMNLQRLEVIAHRAIIAQSGSGNSLAIMPGRLTPENGYLQNYRWSPPPKP